MTASALRRARSPDPRGGPAPARTADSPQHVDEIPAGHPDLPERKRTMRIGVFHLMSTPPWTNSHDVISQHIEQVVEADRLGFDTAWVAEHNVRDYALGGSITVTMAAMAAATRRIRIGTAVARLPLHHPLHLAEDLAFVDNVSRGRLDFGIGKGYDELEFATYGVPFEERVERWEEAYEAITQIWQTGRTKFKGEFHEIPDAPLYPMPQQRPSPPIYVMVVKSIDSIKWAARHLYPFVMGQGPTWDEARDRLKLFADTASDTGHSDADIEHALSRCWQLKQVHVAETTKIAVEQYREPFSWFFGALHNRTMFGFPNENRDYEWFLDHRSLLLGSPEKVRDDLLEYREYTGIQNVAAWFNCGGQPHPQVLQSLNVFAEQVMPALRAV